MRALPGPSPLPIDSIRLSNTMGVEDFRKIYRSLNRNGQLSSLAPWFEFVPDEDLKQVAEIVSQELYESALDKRGLVQILAERNRRNGFTDWKEKNPIAAGKSQNTFWSYLNHFEFITLFTQHVSLLDLDLQTPLQNLSEWASRYSYQNARETKEFNKEQMAKEVRVLFSNEEFKKEALTLLRSLSETGKFERLIQAFVAINEKNPRSFLAFSNALDSFSDQRLQELLGHIQYMDQKPEGFFSLADSYLKKNPEFRRSIAREFQPYLRDVLLDNTVDSFFSTGTNPITYEQIVKLPRADELSPPTAEFKEVMENIRNVMIFNFSLGDKETLLEWFNPVLNMYAYLLTKTLEDVAKVNPESLNTKPENFWKTNFVVKKTKVVLSSSTTGELNPSMLKDFTALGMLADAEFLKPLLFNKSIFPTNQYLLETENGKATLDQVIRQSLQVALTIKPLVEPGVVLNMLLTKLNLEGLEKSDNLLTLIHSVFAGLSVQQLDSLDNLLFHKLELHKFTPERLEIFYPMYGDRQDLKDKLTKLFRCITLLHEFHHEGYEGVSGLELPWAYLNELGPVAKNVTVFNKFFSAFRASGIFKEESATPELKKFFQSPQLLAKYLFALAQLSDGELETVSRKFNGLSASKNWDLFNKLATDSPTEFDYILRRFLEEGVTFLPSEPTLTQKERKLLDSLSTSENLKKTAKLFNQYGSRQNFRQFVKELSKLSESGELSKALDYLGRIQNDRMKKIASTLLSMDKSKQLQALLQLLQTF